MFSPSSLSGSIKNLLKDVDTDICSCFGTSISSSVSNTSPYKDNNSNSSDSVSEHTEPPLKKASRKKF